LSIYSYSEMRLGKPIKPSSLIMQREKRLKSDLEFKKKREEDKTTREKIRKEISKKEEMMRQKEEALRKEKEKEEEMKKEKEKEDIRKRIASSTITETKFPQSVKTKEEIAKERFEKMVKNFIFDEDLGIEKYTKYVDEPLDKINCPVIVTDEMITSANSIASISDLLKGYNCVITPEQKKTIIAKLTHYLSMITNNLHQDYDKVRKEAYLRRDVREKD
jgi:hypothetical protein